MMVIYRNMQQPSNFMQILIKVLINVHLLVNELCECMNYTV